MFWKIFLLLLVIWMLYKRWQKRRLYGLSRKLKSDFRKYPFIGNAYLLVGNEEERMKAIELIGRDSIKHGGISNFWLGEHYNVVLSDADDMKFVLKECLEKNAVVEVCRSLIGNASVIAPVSTWRPKRKMLTPIFHHNRLDQFMDVFRKQSEILVEKLDRVCGTGCVSMWGYITAYAKDVVCETTLGVPGNAQKGGTSDPFVRAFDDSLRILTRRMVRPWLHSNLVYKLLPINTIFMKNKLILTNFINDVISTKRDDIKKEQSALKHMQDGDQNEMKTSMSTLIELASGAGCTDLELQEESLMLVLAATDTSAGGISFTALMLAKHADLQEKVYQELQDVFGDSNRDIVAEDLPRLKYLGAVINESLRLFPPIPVIVRKVQRDIALPSGVTLVKGCGIGAHIWALHRNPRYWGEDAEIFDPERFMKPLNYPKAFMPFSYGPRNCIGYQYAIMSMKIVLSYLVRKYRLLPAEDLIGIIPPINKPLRLIYDAIIKDSNDFKLKLETRSRTNSSTTSSIC